MSKPPNISDLYAVRVAERLGGIATNEAHVRLAMERINRAPKVWMRRQASADLLLARVVQQAVIFAIDFDTMVVAANSADPGLPELPPLPFPDVVIEADVDATWPIHDEHGKTLFRLQNAWIQEVEQGARWDGALFVQGPDLIEDLPEGIEDYPVEAVTFSLTPEGATFWQRGDKKGISYAINDALCRFPVEAVHFMTARGVSLSTIAVSRQVKRNAVRKGVALPERLYWVHIKDELINHIGGDGTREFHCRWLVRGHWRRLSAERKTWVKPYIKGPAGAPWRGRPIYHVAEVA